MTSPKSEVIRPGTDRHEPVHGEHLPALDGIRACAVAMVLLTHARAACGSDLWGSRAVSLYGNLTYLGERGVDLFFVLSGFLITGILLDLRSQPNRWRVFLARRTLRIFPLYYAFLAAFATLAAFSADSALVAWRGHQVWYWAYLQNWWNCLHPADASFPWLAHFWTLSIEEQFYLCWPIVVWAIPRRALLGICAAIVAGSPIVRWWFGTHGASSVFMHEATIVNLDALAIGSAVAAAARGAGLLRLVRPAKIIAGIAAIGLAVALMSAKGRLSYGALPGTGLALLFASIVVLAVTASPASYLARMLSWRPLRHLGARSYAVYVLHLPLMLSLAPLWSLRRVLSPIVNHLAFTFAALALSLVAAEITWRLIERPFLSLKRPIQRPSVQPVAVVVS